jgi:hypothetical protein
MIGEEFSKNLPAHKCGLYLEHNACRDAHQTVEKWLESEQDWNGDPNSWKSDEQRQRAIATNEVWTLQWYPETPIGSHTIAAPTIDELLQFASEFEGTKE